MGFLLRLSSASKLALVAALAMAATGSYFYPSLLSPFLLYMCVYMYRLS